MKTKTRNPTKKDYVKAYNLLMDYWDYIPDEDKEEVSKKLKKLHGL